MKNILFFYFVLLIAMFSFSDSESLLTEHGMEKYEAEWVIDGRVFEWLWPITSRSWIRKAYIEIDNGNGYEWLETKDCKWNPVSVKFTGYIMLGRKIKIVLIKPKNIILIRNK